MMKHFKIREVQDITSGEKIRKFRVTYGPNIFISLTDPPPIFWGD